ncbi:phytochelatin synthase family protein [Endozoicomonas sp.]|uniref:phytochelatin synthase family protein n=1 Tax=Endozoicomonas sp. TaxID=1892382 RepID=UPI00383BE3BF
MVSQRLIYTAVNIITDLIKNGTMIVKNKCRICLGMLLCLTGFYLQAAEHNTVIYWNTPEAIPLQQGLSETADFWQLVPHLTTQKNQTYCGIASAVTVLNTIGTSQDGDPVYYPYTYITQDSFFTPSVLPYLFPKRVMARGADMTELHHALQAHGVAVNAISGDTLTVDELRTLLSRELVDSENYLLVNYQRSFLQQRSGGHWSVLAAYDYDSDRALILDVARYSYPPVWVSLPALLAAINSSDSGGKTRGLLMVSGQPHSQGQQDSEKEGL